MSAPQAKYFIQRYFQLFFDRQFFRFGHKKIPVSFQLHDTEAESETGKYFYENV